MTNPTARKILLIKTCKFFLHPKNGCVIVSSKDVQHNPILDKIHAKIDNKRIINNLIGAKVTDKIRIFKTSKNDHESLLVNGSISEM